MKLSLKNILALLSLLLPLSVHAKTFQNSYISFDVPDNWTCRQEGVAWTCTPTSPLNSKEAVIVLAAKVAGPEDNLNNFKSFLAQPKRIVTKVGTPMPSKMMYAQERTLAGTKWIQAQHLGSEIQDFYTLYLATVKDQLAILVSFSAEYQHYQDYNAIFDKAIKSLKIVASQELLFPKKKNLGRERNEQIAIQPLAAPAMNPEDLLPPPEKKRSKGFGLLGLIALLAIIGTGLGVYFINSKDKPSPKPKRKPR